MTRTICVNRKWFERGIGYGCWGIITVVLMTFTIASVIEMNNTWEKQDDRWGKAKTCYQSIILNKPICTWWVDDLYIANTGMIMMSIGNFVVIGFWIYIKQDSVKFSWCEK